MNDILQVAGIPILTALACFYFAFRLLVFKDTDSIRGNMNRELKDKEGYTRMAGSLLIVFGLCSCIMAALLFVDRTAAVIEITLSLVIVMVLWSFVERRYGSPRP